MPAPRRNLDDLVGEAGAEISSGLRRGRGLEGLVGPLSAAGSAAEEPPLQQAGNPASQQASRPSPIPPAEPVRRNKTFRMDVELARRLDIYAAIQQRNLYEIVEEALEAYLEAHRVVAG